MRVLSGYGRPENDQLSRLEETILAMRSWRSRRPQQIHSNKRERRSCMREKCKRHHRGTATLYRLVSGLTCAAAAAAGLASCASSPVGHGVAADEFHRLGPGGKKVANEFYSYGVSDEIKNLYWGQ